MTGPSNISKRRATALKEGSSDYLAKRAELVEIAAQQFKQSGYRATTLAEIGRKAGLDRATVYYYFGSKEELFREILRTGVDANIRECVRISRDEGLSALEKLEAVVRQLMKAYDEHYPHMYVYIQEEMERIASEKSVWAKEIASQTRKFERIVLDLVSQAVRDGELRSDIPVSVAANAIFGMVNWTHRWYQPGGYHSADVVGGAFASIFLDGMRVGKKR
ncbi:MAG: TetR family transcriptional regulator [Novosphingobium sp.]|nr:TetR family transcriptional regulator [Novosphingobium sp.]